MPLRNQRWLRRLPAGFFLCVSLLAAAPLAAISPAARAETLKVAGTGAALGTMNLLATEFMRQHPSIKIEVLPYIGSTGAIRNVASGLIDLGLSGRTLNGGEDKLDVRLSRYALTPLVIACHPEVPLKSLSRDQLTAIYSGQTTRWENGDRARVILRPAHETDNTVLRSMSPALDRALEDALARPGMRYEATDQEAADALEQVAGAIGTTTLALVRSEKRQVGILALDGVMPSIETLKSGQYPHHKPLFLVTRSQPSAAVQAFVAFVRSPLGQNVLNANGQLPVNP